MEASAHASDGRRKDRETPPASPDKYSEKKFEITTMTREPTWDDSSPLSRTTTIVASDDQAGKAVSVAPVSVAPEADVQSLIEQARYLEGRFNLQFEQTPFIRVAQRLIFFCQKYAPAVDLFAQYGGSPALVIWGSMRALLLAAESSVAYFRLLHSALLKITDSLSLAEQFQDIFVLEERVDTALLAVYDAIKVFLDRILTVMRRRKWRRVLDNLTSSFDEQFRDQGENLQRRMQILHGEVKIAHLKRVEAFQGQVREDMESMKLKEAVLVQLGHQQGQKELKDSILRWLSPTDVGADLDRVLKKRKEGTGHWLLNHPEFERWQKAEDNSQSSRCLFVLGSAGRGKSVLAGTAIENLQRSVDTPVAYFFCSGEDENRRNETSICAAIISQIVLQLAEPPSTVVQAYNTAQAYGRVRRSDQDKLLSVLIEISHAVPRLDLVIDGLDECESTLEVAAAFRRAAGEAPRLRLLCLSRPCPGLLGMLKDDTGCAKIDIEQNMVQADIDIYLLAALQRLPCDDNLRRQAYKTLSAAANGMFLYAALGVETLTSAVDARGIQAGLKALPSGINGFYENSLRRLAEGPAARRRLAANILLWVSSSRRALTWPELEYALSWDEETSMFSSERRPFKSSVVELCFPLIEFREDAGVFVLSHASVKDFIQQRPSINEVEVPGTLDELFVAPDIANSLISKRLLTDLANPDTADSVDPDLVRYPLLAYSTMQWGSHVIHAKASDQLKTQVEEALADPSHRSIWIARQTLLDRTSLHMQQLMKMQKQIKAWLGPKPSLATASLSSQSSSLTPAFESSDLMDIQRALLMYDDLPAKTLQSHPPIPAFERLMWVRDLVRAVKMANRLTEALAFFEDALATARSHHGTQSLRTAWLLNSIGLLLDQKGESQRSLDTHHLALNIQQAHLPGDHLDIISTYNEMGRLYRHLGHFAQSEACHRTALAALSAVLPSSDLQVIWTQNTLGRCLQKYGGEERAEEALGLHTVALAGQRALLGADHPHPIWTLTDLARCYRDLGRLGEARAMLEEALGRRRRVLGVKHPDTLWTVNSLALIVEEMGQLREARELHEEAYAGQCEVLGPEHPHAKWSLDEVEKVREREQIEAELAQED